VQEKRAVGLMYGQRALMIGALHPVNYTGTAQSTSAREVPFQRLAHTGNAFEKVFFGTREEADGVLAFVEKLHHRVNGALSEDAGVWPAGTPYDAFDPELMLWTVAVMMDSAEVLHDNLVRGLTSTERERLWSEYVRFGELFGMPRAVAPQTYSDFRNWFDAMLASEQVHLTDEAFVVGSQVALAIPMPAHVRPARRAHNLVLVGTLPERVRQMYRLRWTPAHEAAYRALAFAISRSWVLLPAAVRRGRNTKQFELVARAEREMIRSGRASMHGLDASSSLRSSQPFEHQIGE